MTTSLIIDQPLRDAALAAANPLRGSRWWAALLGLAGPGLGVVLSSDGPGNAAGPLAALLLMFTLMVAWMAGTYLRTRGRVARHYVPGAELLVTADSGGMTVTTPTGTYPVRRGDTYPCGEDFGLFTI